MKIATTAVAWSRRCQSSHDPMPTRPSFTAKKPNAWLLDEPVDHQVRLAREAPAHPDEREDRVEQVEHEHGLHDPVQPAEVLGRAHAEPGQPRRARSGPFRGYRNEPRAVERDCSSDQRETNPQISITRRDQRHERRAARADPAQRVAHVVVLQAERMRDPRHAPARCRARAGAPARRRSARGSASRISANGTDSVKLPWRRIRVASSMLSPCRIEMPVRRRIGPITRAERDHDQRQQSRVEGRDGYQGQAPPFEMAVIGAEIARARGVVCGA